MKPQKYLLPYGAALKISSDTGISPDTIRKCLKGQIHNICSEQTAQRIYLSAVKYGAIKVKTRK